MKTVKSGCAILVCLFLMLIARNVSAQTALCDTVNGNRFNLENRVNAVPQTSESVAFLPNRVSPGVDLVVGAADDNRRQFLGEPGFPNSLGFDAYYVHRSGANCTADFEGSLSTNSLGTPTVVADPARDGFFLADDLSSAASQIVEVARTTAANLLSASACPNGTQGTAQAATCWPIIGLANFTNPNPNVQATLLHPHMAVDPRTSGTGAGDVYIAAEFEDSTNFPAVASIQVIACTNANVSCGPPVVASGTDTFGSYPYIQVRANGIITISYWTFTKPFGAQPNPIDIKFVTCTPQGAPKPPVCSTPSLVATSNLPFGFAPADNGFKDFVFPKHVNRLEADGKTVTTFLVYDRCRSIIGNPRFLAPPCSKVDVVLETSTDGGATWSVPHLVSMATGHQFFGMIAIDASTATVSVAYYSTQNDPFGQRPQLFLNQIPGGSMTGGSPRILTSAADDPDAGIQDLTEPQGEQVVNFGDRIGLAAGGNGSAGQSRAYVHYTWNNVAGISNGVAQPDPNNTLTEFSY